MALDEKMVRRVKPETLEEAVLMETPDKLAKVFKSLGEVDFTACALGLACRFGGLEKLKVLVDGGAIFNFDLKKISRLWNFHPSLVEGENYAKALLEKRIVFNTIGKFYDRKHSDKLLPIEKRLAMVDYLCETADKSGLDKDELLFYAYFSDKSEIKDRLKKNGAVVPERYIKLVTEGSWDDWSKEKWAEYCTMIDELSDDEFMPSMTAFVSELGGRKLHYTEALWRVGLEKRGDIPGFFRFLIENFEPSKINKGKMMKSIIERDCVDGLAAAAELGWLKQPKKRDEMIEFATDSGKTECAGWLQNFKNRTADRAAEHKRAEKKAERELNADPTSAEEMKKLWSWEARKDGTLVITGYKGNKTEITVPKKIGGDTVTAIGEYAFSPDFKELNPKQRDLRKAVTEIRLPDTITEIGEFAFCNLKLLTHFDIPSKLAEIPKGMLQRSGLKDIVIGGNVKKICWGAFFGCADLRTAVLGEGVEEIEIASFPDLETIELPKSVTRLAEGWISGNRIRKSDKTTVILHKGSYAEQHCTEKKLPFKYVDLG